MENWPVNPVDIVVLVVLVISGALAFFRGFVHEILGIGAWIGAILAAIYGLPQAQPYVRQYIPIDWLADLVTVVGIFLVALIVLSFISVLIARRVQDSALNSLDRTLGFVFGLARGGVIVLVLYIAGSQLVPPDTQPPWMREARSMPMIEESATRAIALLPPELTALLKPEEEDDGEGEGEGEGATAATDGGGTAPDAGPSMDAQRAFEALRRPEPGADETGGTGGYGSGERQGMDRLMESTQ
jgi:membrane protein required for colicin V production